MSIINLSRATKQSYPLDEELRLIWKFSYLTFFWLITAKHVVIQVQIKLRLTKWERKAECIIRNKGQHPVSQNSDLII